MSINKKSLFAWNQEEKMKLTVAHRNQCKVFTHSIHQSANYELAIIDDEFSLIMLIRFEIRSPFTTVKKGA